jgi:hypothetical protein
MPEVRDQKDIYIDSTDNYSGKNSCDFIVNLDRNSFQAVEPEVIRINCKQFSMKKTWYDINSLQNQRFFISCLEPGGVGVFPATRMYPCDLITQYQGNRANPYPKQNGVNVVDFCRYDPALWRSNLPNGPAVINDAVPGYSYTQGPRNPDLRTIIEYSINMTFRDIALGLITYNGVTFPANSTAGPPAGPYLAVQVRFDSSTRQFSYHFLNGLPNARFPEEATNVATGTAVEIVSNRVQFHFPEIPNPTIDALNSAFPVQLNNPLYLQDMANDPVGCNQTTYKLMCGRVARPQQPSQVDGAVYGVAGLVNTGFLPDTTLFPTATTEAYWGYNPAQIDCMENIYIRSVNLPSQNFSSIGSSQNHNFVPKTAPHGDIICKIPLPIKRFTRGNNTGFRFYSEDVPDYPSAQAQYVQLHGDHQLVGAGACYDKIDWLEPHAGLFGITINNPTLDSVGIQLTDEKGRNLSGMGYDNVSAIQGNLMCNMVLCFHKIYIAPVPRPMGSQERQQLPQTVLEGGVQNNDYLLTNAMLTNTYNGPNTLRD